MADGTPCPCYADRQLACPFHGPLAAGTDPEVFTTASIEFVKAAQRGRDSVRQFESGATRDVDTGKYDYEAFLSPRVVQRYGEYMHKNRHQKDGSLRDGDNWQKGIPKSAYMKSAWRHFVDWWLHHRGLPAGESLEDALCAVIFNASGYLHEILKENECRTDT